MTPRNHDIAGVQIWQLLEKNPQKRPASTTDILKVLEQSAEAVVDRWKPWLKKCYGASDVGYYNPWSVTRFVWIDQDLKEEMTGKR